MPRELRRRDVIRGIGAAGTIGLAGCADDGDGDGGGGDGGNPIENESMDWGSADDGNGENESEMDGQTQDGADE